jgi:hypothetical protein
VDVYGLGGHVMIDTSWFCRRCEEVFFEGRGAVDDVSVAVHQKEFTVLERCVMEGE